MAQFTGPLPESFVSPAAGPARPKKTCEALTHTLPNFKQHSIVLQRTGDQTLPWKSISTFFAASFLLAAGGFAADNSGSWVGSINCASGSGSLSPSVDGSAVISGGATHGTAYAGQVSGGSGGVRG